MDRSAASSREDQRGSGADGKIEGTRFSRDVESGSRPQLSDAADGTADGRGASALSQGSRAPDGDRKTRCPGGTAGTQCGAGRARAAALTRVVDSAGSPSTAECDSRGPYGGVAFAAAGKARGSGGVLACWCAAGDAREFSHRRPPPAGAGRRTTGG